MTSALLLGAGVLGVLIWAWWSRRPATLELPEPEPEPVSPDIALATLLDLEARCDALTRPHERDWLPRSALRRWQAAEGALPMPDSNTLEATRLALDGAERIRLNMALGLLCAPADWVQDRNARWLADTLRSERVWLDRVLPHPLHADQRRAVLVNEDHNVVIAGAGTGKTATLAARIVWLVKRQGQPPRSILALAYNKAAAQELSARVERLGIAGVTVLTFHALGLRLLSEADRRQPPVSPLATDDEARGRFIDAQVRALLQSAGSLQAAVKDWFTEFFQQDHQRPPRSHAEYLAQDRTRERRTLNGQRLRSMQEVYIANWLTLNGIAWEYERSYEPDGRQPGEKRYLPDFYLPAHDLWLEHWGISRSGSGLPGLNVKRYRAQIEWKRALHTKYGTTLLETWSDDITDGRTHETLAALMKAHKVPTRSLRPEEVDALVAANHGAASRLGRLLGQFLTLFRGLGLELVDLRPQARNARDQLFLILFEPILRAWRRTLADARQIDFDDMLVRGAREVREGRARAPWRHILVDELQDASLSRVALVEALRDATPGARVTGVGDDWQSIYRFAGSDVQLFASLDQRWTGVEVTELRQTWRLAYPGLVVSGRFVARNPSQRTKALQARPDARSNDPVVVVWTRATSDTEPVVETLREIARRTPRATVLLLARYNRLLEARALLPIRREAIALGLTIDARTVHRAKGLEADHVIVLGLQAASMGFPSTVEDDPVLTLVLSRPEQYAFAEERRLFYVALSRARHSTWLMTPDHDPSPFVTELLDAHAQDGLLEQRGVRAERHRCPTCGDCSIVKKEGNHGPFWACSHYPVCDGRLPTCSSCGQAPIIQDAGETGTVWVCPACTYRVPACPQCGSGHLVNRQGKYGPFLCCSEWRADGDGCSYTQHGQLRSPARWRSPVSQTVGSASPRPRVDADPAVRPTQATSTYDLPWEDLGPLVFLDVETTGRGPQQHIIEVAALRWEGNQLVDHLVTLIDPGVRQIEFTDIHRITRGDLDGAPTWPLVLPALRRVLDGAIMVAHNASFEAGALRTTLSRYGGSWDGKSLCTLKLARRAHPERKGKGAHTLRNLALLHGLTMHSNAHAAFAYAAVLPGLLSRLLARAPDTVTRRDWLTRSIAGSDTVQWGVESGPDPRKLKARG